MLGIPKTRLTRRTHLISRHAWYRVHSLHRRPLRRIPQMLMLVLRRRGQARVCAREWRRRGAPGIPPHPFPIRRRVTPARRVRLLHRRALLVRLLPVEVDRVVLRRLLLRLLLLLLLLALIWHADLDFVCGAHARVMREGEGRGVTHRCCCPPWPWAC